jgi:cyclophilin family peptidyl-prolyl cis-trans isomerase
MESKHYITGAIVLSLLAIIYFFFLFNSKNTDIPLEEVSESTETEYNEPMQETTKKQYDNPPEMVLKENTNYKAKLTTSKGEITVDLFEEKVPVTVNNFVFLANDSFYDGVVFHRVMKEFMIQTGDPQGTGMGGPGYRFKDEEFEGEYTAGTLAMANAGPDTNGSQFFIMHKDYPLPPNYVIFGKVEDDAGLSVVDAIATSPVQPSATGEVSDPVEKIVVEKIEIIEE